ncbi:zinc finger protein 43-like [Spodoptera litura]|uniref:Zinc finger protein 43-like n=1 Tax=Spodoptera litura TaxID=69820 RepID=A0A9J7IZQ5_SPOLT|nr:zinc finger protein 43-like [Spodoptera litura]
MNHHGNMEMDPLSYDYPTYSYQAPTYPYPNKLQAMYQAYAQTNTNFVPTMHNTQHNTHNIPEPVKPNPVLPTSQTEVKEVNSNDNVIQPTSKRKKKDKKGEKGTFCSEKITDASFKFYGCSVCNISYSALHELDQHVTIHKNRLTSYRLRLRNQFKKKQIKKEKKKLKKLSKIKKESEMDVEIKPEDGYIGSEKAADLVMNNEIENNGNVNNGNSVIDNQSSQFNSVNGELSNVSNDNSLNNGDMCNKVDRVNDKSMNETEINDMEKIYKCFACNKQFTLSYYLKLHVRSHTDEKPYTCAACGQSFITASKLGRHNKRIHLAERYQCRICFKIFSKFELLTAHFDKTHPEDKLEGEPYGTTKHTVTSISFSSRGKTTRHNEYFRCIK